MQIQSPSENIRHEALSQVCAAVLRKMPGMKLDLRAFNQYPQIVAEVEVLIGDILASGRASADAIADAYLWLCHDHFSCQKHLLKHGCYKYASFDEVNRNHYQQDVMKESYLTGLLVSNALWPNHAAIADRFVNDFLPHLKPGSRILEIGCGPGFYSYLALRFCTGSFLHALDISPHSISFTDELLRRQHIESGRYELELGNIFEWPGAADYDAVLVAEVIEHLEAPQALLESTQNFVAPEGRIWITTCANAGHTDHIFLFEGVAEIRELLTASGLKILQDYRWALQEMDEAQLRKRRVPVNYAAVCAAESK